MADTMPEINRTDATLQLSADDFTSFGSQQTISASEAAMLSAVATTGGLVTTAEALTLYRLCQRLPAGARVLEIGSYLGASTTAIAHAILGRGVELYCLDCWYGYLEQGFFEHVLANTASTDHDIFSTFQKNTLFLGDQLRILKGSTTQFKAMLPNHFFDLIFIDAAHDYDNVTQDIIIALKTITPGGLICGHDYHSDGDGVRNAVNELIASAEKIHTKGVVKDTSIWYSTVEHPDFEYEKISILEELNRNPSAMLLKKALSLYRRHSCEEALLLITLVKQALAAQKPYTPL